MENNKISLDKVRAYCFAALDLNLFLDTHPDDRKAFELFKETVKKAQELKREYEKNCGPLSSFASAEFERYKWLESPWPWEKEAN